RLVLLGHEVSRHLEDALDAGGVLRGQRRDHRRAVHAECSGGLQVRLHTGAPGRVGACDTEHHRRLFHGFLLIDSSSSAPPSRPLLRRRAASTASRSRRAARSGSAAAQIAETTATPSAPAVTTSAAFDSSIPPIATNGIAGGIAALRLATPSSPNAAVVSGLLGVGQTGLAAR